MHFVPSTNHELLWLILISQPQIPGLAFDGGMKMGRRSLRVPRIDRSMILGLTLCGVWFAGVSLGLWAACFYGSSVADLSLIAGCAPLYYPGACVAVMLPLFLSAFAVFFFHRAGAYLACAVRGIFIGYMLGCAVMTGGFWLGLLLLFSGLWSSPVLLWFLWHRLTLGADRFVGDALGVLAATAMIAAVDTWVVAPFLARALSF